MAGRSTEQNQDMIALLEDLKVCVTEQDRRRIDALLAQVVDDVSNTASLFHPPQPTYDDRQGEVDVSAEVGSNEDLDIMDEDVLRNEGSRATGFIGKSSELQWLRRLRQDAERSKGASSGLKGPYGPPGDSTEAAQRRTEALRKRQQHDSSIRMRTSASTFYLDNDNIDVSRTVNPFELPSRETAQRLLDGYMTTVQDSFPILPETLFKHQFDQYYTSVMQGMPSPVPPKWLAILNLVFAIGAKYLQLMEADWEIGGQDHHLYWSRAHALGLDGSFLVAHPDLMQIQTTALLAFYFLSIGHVNRAWVVMGFSLRFAHALGLHVRNEDRTATVPQKEILLRMWWGLYSLEGILSTIVGRPSFVLEEYCSAPLPLPLATEQLLDEALTCELHERYRGAGIHQNAPQVASAASEPPNAGSYLKSRVQVGIITQKVMIELYSASVVTKSWKQVQQATAGLCQQLEAWLVSLPSDLNFTQAKDSTSFQRERLMLQTYYIGTKILITRPCLCRLDRRIANQTKASSEFDKQTARLCVGAAKAVASLLPDLIDTTYLYKIGPWWSVVHNLMQALIVLLLEMSYGAVHFPEDGKEILPSIKKLIRWLSTMAKNNEVAGRAYTMALRVLQGLAPRLNADISDLIWEDAARSKDSETFDFEDQFTAGEHGRAYPFSAGADAGAFGGEGMRASDFYNNQTGYASMFGIPARQPQAIPSFLGSLGGGGELLSDFPGLDPMFGNPFVTGYDEENPVTSGEDFFNMDAFMLGSQHRQARS
ncbi:fungal-specific transcription factor domain-containing protein [Dendryphion nanum]|uniref:Fungal-specific transcription factor domain-containing protein n=1 Tax=Dendryphion nanum TaxID=256645 RepID=A0A9P9CXZ1_9PLEO|nr:fungal-specific transcription factor domain-containing protein [Dendryphion nanum]